MTLGMTAPNENTTIEFRSSYMLCRTVFRRTAIAAFPIDDDLRIQWATPEQITSLKGSFTIKMPGEANENYLRYENDIIEEQTNSGVTRHLVGIPENAHRYLLVVCAKHNSDALHRFARFGRMLDPPIELAGFVYASGVWGGGEVLARSGRQGHLNESIADSWNWRIHNLTPEYLASVKRCWQLFNETTADPEFGFIEKATSMLFDLGSIPKHHELYVLGLFAIIELLLTHIPNDREYGDSLTHQIRTKMPLVSNRMTEPISAEIFSELAASQDVWKLLYSVRSKIAHGESLDFESGKYAALSSLARVVEYLEQATRKLTRYCLEEPLLISDLKKV
jgi:hypothetical protein